MRPGRTRITPGGAACSEPVPKEDSVNFIKRIVAGPATRSRSTKAT